MSGYSQDRAGVVSRAVLQIVTRELRAWADGEPDADIAAVCPEIESILRNEFQEIACQVRDEIAVTDD
ncbi:MAG: hypothetical protein WA322_05405 [Pseudolabrys sp.]